MELRPLNETELLPAIALVWEVFNEFEAPGYSDEGIKSFREYIEYENIAAMLESGEMKIIGCFLDGAMSGVLAVKKLTHISLLFVKKVFHRQGIATMLFHSFAESCAASKAEKITVNSAPYAVEFYEKMGFIRTDDERVEAGIRYIPMQYTV